MRYRKNFRKTVWGYAEVEASDLDDATGKFESGDWIDEYDNESDYLMDEDVYEA